MKPFLVVICLLFSFGLYAQSNYAIETKDSSFFIPMIQASYAYQFPGNDMKERFGSNSNIGGSFMLKTKSNWYYGIKGNFIWGKTSHETSILDAIQTSDGFIIDSDGLLTSIYLEERGSSFFVVGGRLFNQLGLNKNSGLLIYGGVGTLHHKIGINYIDEIPNLNKDYKKGYDRLSFGFAVNGFVGYLYLGKSRIVNFFGGVDITQGWTKNLRKFNFDTQQLDNEKRSDFLIGPRVGWIIRLNKRTPQEFYYD